MLSEKIINKITSHKTPFYFYDLELLQHTLAIVKSESAKYNYHVHYAFKANTNPRIIEQIQKNGLGADCVSGNEVKCAIENNFDSSKIVFAGVGKSDDEINYALDKNIFCFNCESIQDIDKMKIGKAGVTRLLTVTGHRHQRVSPFNLFPVEDCMKNSVALQNAFRPDAVTISQSALHVRFLSFCLIVMFLWNIQTLDWA